MEPEGMNPQLLAAVDRFAVASAESFAAIWSRPDAAATMERFLSDEVVFVITRDQVQVLARDEVRPRDPDGDDGMPGQYL